MACRLTYKNLKFDSIEQLNKFLKLESVVSKVKSLESVSNSNLRNLLAPSLVSSTDTKLQNTFDSSDLNGLVIEELYSNEGNVTEKFDSCYGRG